MMNLETVPWTLALLLTSCATSGLDALVLDGHELHASLVTAPPAQLAESPVGLELADNPQLSTDAWFVEDIARRASQGGPLDGQGVRAALLAVYLGEEQQLGIYGLEAASPADADRIEGIARDIWAHNARLGLARVHRGGEVVVVVWAAARESPSYWDAANAVVARRVGASGSVQPTYSAGPRY